MDRSHLAQGHVSGKTVTIQNNSTAPVFVSSQWVYTNLICEFGHWDICLTGLVDRNGEKWFCKVCDPDEEDVKYTILPVKWTEECDEYLTDYRVAYKHWFHEGAKRCSYDGWPLVWFGDKWKHRNPIEEMAQ